MSERQQALHLLQRIERESLYASLLLLGETGFVRTAVLGVLRWRSRLDWMIEQLAERRVTKLDPPVLDVLRLGLYQLFYMDAPAYAVVSESADLDNGDLISLGGYRLVFETGDGAWDST